MRIGGWLIGVWNCHDVDEQYREVGALHQASGRYVSILRIRTITVLGAAFLFGLGLGLGSGG